MKEMGINLIKGLKDFYMKTSRFYRKKSKKTL